MYPFPTEFVMHAIMVFFDSFTAGQLFFFLFSHLILSGLGVAAGFSWGSDWFKRRREDEVTLVAIERKPGDQNEGTYLDLGAGFPFTESGTMYITPTSFVTTRLRAHRQGATRRSTEQLLNL